VSEARPPRLAVALGLAGIVVLALAVLAALDRNRIEDDAYMFVRYARNLAASGRLAWNPGGEPTYGLTSLAYFVLVFLLEAVLRADPAIVLVTATLLAGGAFVVFAVRMARQAVMAAHAAAIPDSGARARARAWAAAIALGGLAWASPTLAQHCVSGMDTAFTLAFTTVLVTAGIAWANAPVRRRVVVWGALGGASLWVRPDLLPFGIGVPAVCALLAPTAARRRDAGLAAGIAVAIALALAGLAWLLLGAPLPLSMYGKVLRGYGTDMPMLYAGFAARQLAAFGREQAPFIALALAGLVLHVRRLGVRAVAFDVAVALTVIVFVVFQRFFVLPIMGDDQRFFYPALPAIVYLAVRGWMALVALPGFARGGGGRVALVVGLAALAALAVPLVRSARELVRAPRLVDFRVADNFRTGWPGRMWVGLDVVATFPDDLVIATTEVGHPGVMAPRKVIVDLAGLNDTDFARHGFSAARLFARARPDLFYLTVRHYADIRTALLRDQRFRDGYELLHPPEGLVIALRRDGAHYTALRTALAPR
jgi:hypothetical protein